MGENTNGVKIIAANVTADKSAYLEFPAERVQEVGKFHLRRVIRTSDKMKRKRKMQREKERRDEVAKGVVARVCIAGKVASEKLQGRCGGSDGICDILPAVYRRYLSLWLDHAEESRGRPRRCR